MERSQAYAVLGLASGAPSEAVRAAYIALSKNLHPDLEGGDAERFKTVAAAYGVLRSRPSSRAEAPAASASSAAGPAPGPNLAAEVTIPLECILTGATVPVPGFDGRCGECHGTGQQAEEAPYPCADCGGNGSVMRVRGIIRMRVDCATCGGRGEITAAPCQRCRGSGQGTSQEVRIEVPPGHPEGDLLRVPGLGGPGIHGGRRGDLLVQVHTVPHPRFRRRGSDLVTGSGVDFADLCLGASIAVEPLGGGEALMVPVPPGTRAGGMLAVEGAGLPRPDGGGRGRLLVRVMPRVPQTPSPQQVALLRRWRDLSRS